MKQSTQKQLKNSIIEFLMDGKEHSISEIKSAVEKRGIVIEEKSSKLRTALYFLKQEDLHLINPEKGVYKYIVEKKESEDGNEFDLSEFEHINASPRESLKMVVSVMADGTIALNGQLLKCIENCEAEIKLKADSSYLALIKDGIGMVKFGKNGRTKNYELVNKISQKKKKLPVYYVGEWDGKGKVWLGKLIDYNPNNGKKK